jgi:hypothetical protein
MARKPPALARELLRNFPKRRARNARRRRKGTKGGARNGRGPDPSVVGGMSNTSKERQAKRTRSSRARNGGKRTGAPTDGVLTEALSSAHPQDSDGVGKLDQGSGDELQRNVEEALNHAGADPGATNS